MKIDHDYFYPHIRQSLFSSRLSTPQFNGLQNILDVSETIDNNDPRFLAYELATAYWETGQTMQPVPEDGRGRGRAYGVPVNGHVYYGRGLVQLTWDYNYKKMSSVVGADLLADPDLALRPDYAAKIMFSGMTTGAFTGKKLSDYINSKMTDFLNARRIINGMDKAAVIRDIANKVLASIKVVPEKPAPSAPLVAEAPTVKDSKNG